jgi:hypothetical protein
MLNENSIVIVIIYTLRLFRFFVMAFDMDQEFGAVLFISTIIFYIVTRICSSIFKNMTAVDDTVKNYI